MIPRFIAVSVSEDTGNIFMEGLITKNVFLIFTGC